MKRSLIAFSILSASFSVCADTAFHPAGENLTYGSVANHQSLISYTNNPATGSSALDNDDWYIGFGLVTSFGVGAEVGAVDNFTEQVDDLTTQLKDFSGDSIDAVEAIKTTFDSFLIDAGENGSAQVNVAVTAPLFPIVWSSRALLGGSLVLDMNAAALAQLSILDRPIEYNPLEQGTNILQTNSAVYIKVGAVADASLAYSRPVIVLDEGILHAGVRGKYYQVGLSKTLIGLSTMQDGAETALEDELDGAKDTSLQSGIGLDLGVLWTSKNYRLGAWVKNANSPSFKYDSIGGNCEALEVSRQEGCYIATSFANEIDLEENYVIDAQINLEGSVYSDSRNFVGSFSLDTSPVNDPVGNQLQWATISAGYATSSWLIPGIRAGYRKNLAGSQLSAVTAGVTLFKTLHVDAAYGLETVDVDGTAVPRMLQLNVGLDLLF